MQSNNLLGVVEATGGEQRFPVVPQDSNAVWVGGCSILVAGTSSNRMMKQEMSNWMFDNIGDP